MKIKRCIDCGKIVSCHSTGRCNSCAAKIKIKEGIIGKKGKECPRWKGGLRYGKEGYLEVYLPEHPNTTSNGYVLAHRLVVEEIIGRCLKRTELIHHLNGIKNDNRPENLGVVTKRTHNTQSYIQQLQARIRELEVNNG